jgi:death on curing protein
LLKPVFLELAEVLEIHRNQIGLYGGRPGLRDLGLLQSALAQPVSGIRERYFHSDLMEMAAAYLFHIVRDHPFIDGNKRTGAVAALVFLDFNGVEMDADQDDFEALVWSVAKGKSGKSDITGFYRKNAK